MKFTIAVQQVKAINETFDIALKSSGLQRAYQIYELTQLIRIENEEESVTVELNQNHVQTLTEIFDIALRQLGLAGLYAILGLVELIKNPIEED